ncbi:unnamed protein product [Rhizoctonia solani]|uniref:Uncharacterized protein n=1 Tax=Rhizoctonia solani TaxID=456999 RepID=A0A8H3CFR4_9AGAM|nr:unnamed protein product [Rhizoctonia solani]
MLRWGRWAVVHVIGSRSAVWFESKNVSRIVWTRRQSSHVPVLDLTRGTKAKMTNEETDITIPRLDPLPTVDPLGTLRELLTNKRPDVKALEAAYDTCRAHHLSFLTKSEFSRLVSAVGATPEFVLRVCADQVALGRRIPDSDRYRYMCAHLARGLSCCRELEFENRDTPPSGSSSPALREHLAHAQTHYTKLAKNHNGQAVHQVYLEQLLRIYQRIPSDSKIVDILGCTISDALKSLFSKPRFRFDSRLAQVVWRIIASVRFDESQTRSILHILRLRVSLSNSNWGSETRSLDPIASLREAILDLPSADAGIGQEARSILHDARAWEWLRVLAGGSHEPTSMTGANTRLNVLASLRQLEHAVPGSEASVASLERCWGVWMTILGAEAANTHSSPAYTIDRAILLAFLRLAAQFQSAHVVSGSERLLTVFTSVVCAEDHIHKAQPGSLSVQLGAAYACTDTLNVFQLAARLSAAGFRTDSSRLPAGYITHVVELLLEYRFPQVASEVVSQGSADLPAALVASVAHDCAKAGYVAGAVVLLRDTRLGFEERHRISLACLRQLDRQGGVLTRSDALYVCEALGPDLSRIPENLRPIAVRMALNAGHVRLAGLMGTQWQLQPPLQRLLATRLVKARLAQLASQVVDPRQTRWLSMVLDNAGYHKKIPARARRSRNLFSYGETNATRLGNKILIRSGARLGGRAQLRATLATLARLLRARDPSWTNKRAPFRPDGVTLNIIVRALVRSTFCVSSSDLRALFDLLSRAGRCGLNATGNHFGTEAGFVLGGYPSSAIALAKLVPQTEGPWSFVRYVRPLLRTFVSGLRVRGDQEAVTVITRVLKTEDAHWRRAGWHRAGGPDP